MKKCTKCGAEFADETMFCPECGQAVGVAQENKASDAVAGVINSNDETANYDPNDIANNKLMAALSYLGILFLIPLLAAPQSKFARFHANQGLILCLVIVVVNIASSIVTTIASMIASILGLLVSLVFGILSLATVVLVILGIVNVIQGKAKELPIIGKFRIIK